VDEDIEAIIDIAKHIKNQERPGVAPLNRISSLPDTKRHMKEAVKERMRTLAGVYISLASFIDDDLVDFLENDGESIDKEKVKRIYAEVLEEMGRLRKEMEEFRVTELPTP
jgi:hypothetical protein